MVGGRYLDKLFSEQFVQVPPPTIEILSLTGLPLSGTNGWKMFSWSGESCGILYLDREMWKSP